MDLFSLSVSGFSHSSGFWGFAPRPPPGLCPWTPLVDFSPPDSLPVLLPDQNLGSAPDQSRCAGLVGVE